MYVSLNCRQFPTKTFHTIAQLRVLPWVTWIFKKLTRQYISDCNSRMHIPRPRNGRMIYFMDFPWQTAILFCHTFLHFFSLFLFSLSLSVLSKSLNSFFPALVKSEKKKLAQTICTKKIARMEIKKGAIIHLEGVEKVFFSRFPKEMYKVCARFETLRRASTKRKVFHFQII